MSTANIYDFKTNLSYYIGLVEKGKKVTISKRNIPIAEITPINKTVSKRVIGQAKGEFDIPNSFYEPLPQALLEAFENPK